MQQGGKTSPRRQIFLCIRPNIIAAWYNLKVTNQRCKSMRWPKSACERCLKPLCRAHIDQDIRPRKEQKGASLFLAQKVVPALLRRR